MDYMFWVVECPACETLIALQVIGPHAPTGPQRVYVLKECADFTETCPKCETEHTYSHAEVHQRLSDPPPEDFAPSPAFLEAIARKKQSE